MMGPHWEARREVGDQLKGTVCGNDNIDDDCYLREETVGQQNFKINTKNGSVITNEGTNADERTKPNQMIQILATEKEKKGST